MDASTPFLNLAPRTEAEARAEIGKRMAQEIKDRALRETAFGQRIMEGANQTIYYPDGRVVEIKPKDEA